MKLCRNCKTEIDSDKDVLNKMSSAQSAMKLNFSKIFN